MIVFLDFNSAFDLVNHQGFLYKLKLMCVGGPVFNIFKNFYLIVNNEFWLMETSANFIPVVSGVPQISILGMLLFIFYIADT